MIQQPWNYNQHVTLPPELNCDEIEMKSTHIYKESD
jgi:hypothetical protein